MGGPNSDLSAGGKAVLSDELLALVRQRLDCLASDVEALREILAAVEATRNQLDTFLMGQAGADVGSSKGDGQIETALMEKGAAVVRTGRPRRRGSYYEGHRAALEKADVDYGTPTTEMAKVCGAAGDRTVVPRDMAKALIDLELSKSNMKNLPGYIAKKLKESDEFEWQGRRSGAYTWIGFEEALDGSSDALPPADVGEPAETVE